MELIDPDLAVEGFGYSPIGSRWAVLSLLARMRTDVGLPAVPGLTVADRDGTALDTYPARSAHVERRLRPGGGPGADVLWRVAFALPADVAENPDVTFTLDAGGAGTFTLPIPTPRETAVPGLDLSRAAPSTSSAHAYRRAAAVMTTAAALTAATPGLAHAAGEPTATTTTGAANTAVAATTAASADTTANTDTATAATTTTATTTDPSTATTSSPTSTTATSSPTPTTATTTSTTTTVPTTTSTDSSTTSSTTAPATTVTTTPVAPTATPPTAAPPTSAPTPAAPPATATQQTPPTPATPTAPKPATTNPTTPVPHHHPAETLHDATIAPVHSTATMTTTRGHRHHHHHAHRDHHRRAHHPATHQVTPPALHAEQRLAAAEHHRAAAESLAAARGRALSAQRAKAQNAATRRLAILRAGVRQASAHEQLHRRLRIEADRAQRHQAAGLLVTVPTATSTGGTGGGVHYLSPTPGAWTGLSSPNSALTGAVRDLSATLATMNRPPSFLIPIYMEAARTYRVPWEVLAAINAVESDYGRDLNTSTAGALGWMQFEPSTWQEYGVAADGDSTPNPYDPRDAIFSAARYLAAAGGHEDIRRAVYAYNHAGWYVDEVMERAQAIAEHAQFESATVGARGTMSVYFATTSQVHPRVRYRGGIMSHFDRLIAAANMVSAAEFPYLWGGGHEQPSVFGPFDCSGSVSYVMQQAGYRVPTTVAGDIGAWGFPTGPGRVTIFYNAVHTFMRIGNRFFGTSGFARPGGGAGWFEVDRLPADYLSEFHEVHVPKLGVDSYSAHPRLFPAPETPREHQGDRERSRLSDLTLEHTNLIDLRASAMRGTALVARRLRAAMDEISLHFGV